MNIALIGGLTRSESELVGVARRAGHQLTRHSGDVGGRGAGELKSVIERADLVVMVTELMSHGAMYQAKRRVRALGCRVVVVRKCGVAKLGALLTRLGPAGEGDAAIAA